METIKLGFKDGGKSVTDFGKEKIVFQNGKFMVINMTSMEKDKDCWFSAFSKVMPEPYNNILKVTCKETGTTEFFLKKGQSCTILVEGLLLEEEKKFEAEYTLVGI